MTTWHDHLADLRVLVDRARRALPTDDVVDVEAVAELARPTEPLAPADADAARAVLAELTLLADELEAARAVIARELHLQRRRVVTRTSAPGAAYIDRRC